MEFIRNLQLRTKLVLLLLLVIIPLIYFMQDKLRHELGIRKSHLELRDRLIEADNISVLIHHLQREQGLATGYLVSKGLKFGERLNNQIELVNNHLLANNKYLKSDIQAGYFLSNLPDVRREIKDENPDITQVLSFYSDFLRLLVSRLDVLNTAANDPQTAGFMRSQYDITRTKERLGYIRSVVMGFRPGSTLSLSQYADLASAYAGYQMYMDELRAHAPENLLDYFNAQMLSDSVRYTHQGIQNLLASGKTDSLYLEPENWYEIITTAIDRMRGSELFANNWSKNYADTKIKNTTTGLIVFFSISILLVLLAILIAVYIIRIITRSVNSLKNAAERIAKGDTDLRLRIKDKDEIGQLARSFELVLLNYQDLAVSAERIGAGNYEVDVNVRSTKDILGASLEKMRISLRELDHQNRKRNWMQDGLLRLSDIISGNSGATEDRLASGILAFLAEYLDAEAGIIYTTNENDHLKLKATHAVIESAVVHKALRKGETLTGQVFESGKTLTLNKLPSDFYPVKTGAGSSSPQNVIIYPLIFNDNVEAVIELAFLKPLRGNETEFLDEVSEKAALALVSVRSRQQLEELLYRTQQQAEELEAQQEELRQVNEELTENTKMLQASEEELKVQQEELQEKNQELEEKAEQLQEQYELVNHKHQEVEEASKLLEKKNLQLETTGRYKTEFLANMSHELRTPLNSILILTRLLAENKNGNLDKKQVEFAETIYRSGNDLLKLINEILDLSKIEAGKTTLHPERFHPRELNIAELFEAQARENNINFKVHYDDNLGEIYADRDRLAQVLRNLLSNAFKFTGSGGSISYTVFNASDQHVFRTPGLRESSEVVGFTVTDTGIGIPADKLDLIFEAFQQVDSSTSRKYGGTGLGLSISKELASLMGGEIEVKSSEGKGSEFTLYIPAEFRTQNEPKQSTEIPVKTVDTPKKKPHTVLQPKAESKNEILIVEKDTIFSDLFLESGIQNRINSVKLDTEQDAREYLTKYTPEAIVIDTGSPGLDGEAILQTIQSTPRLEMVPCYVLTQGNREQLSLEPDISFVQKPVSKKVLFRMFEKLTACSGKSIIKVLVVDDDPGHNKAVSELVCSGSHECETATSAEQALELIKEENFDCLILDLTLPGMDGYELMAEVRKLKGYSNTPILVLTGRELSEEEERRIRQFTTTIICKSGAAFERLKREFENFISQKISNGSVKRPDKTQRTSPALTGKTALLVDDDIRNIYALSSVLEEEGMQVITAGDGAEALEKLNQKKKVIDIVLMDIMMPVMDGYEAMRKIRSTPEIAKLPVIALTAKAMPGDRARCIEAGASDYIPKPINTEQLIPLMKVWLYQ